MLSAAMRRYVFFAQPSMFRRFGLAGARGKSRRDDLGYLVNFAYAGKALRRLWAPSATMPVAATSCAASSPW